MLILIISLYINYLIYILKVTLCMNNLFIKKPFFLFLIYFTFVHKSLLFYLKIRKIRKLILVPIIVNIINIIRYPYINKYTINKFFFFFEEYFNTFIYLTLMYFIIRYFYSLIFYFFFICLSELT